jgi:ABC-type uncharacterized transport system involved in gliding motility auxiliary subunit
MERKTKAATESGALLLIIAGILVAINALSALGLYSRKDFTKAEKYTLSKGSANLLQSLKQPMRVDAYVTKGLPKLDAFVRDLRDLLQDYKDAGKGKFDYTITEAKDEDTKKTAKDAGLVEQPFGEANDTDNSAAVTQGFMGLVLKYGSEKDAIKFLPPERADGLEFLITNKIRELRDKSDNIKHKIGVLTGNDEMKLTDANLVPTQMGKPSIQQVITQNFPFYTLVDVDLKAGESEIDETLDGLVITQPAKDLTEKELRRIDQFVLKGKSLALFASAVNVKSGDATMNATLSTHGLEKLMLGYGIEMHKDAVLDFGRSFRVPIITQGGIANARFPQFLEVTEDSRVQDNPNERFLDTSFPAFFRIQQLIFPFVSSLSLKKDVQPDAKMNVLARSTPRSLHETTDNVDLKPFKQWKPKGEWGQYDIAASVEGTLKTAFPTGDKLGVDSPEKGVKSSRVLLISSSEFLCNPLARAGNGQEMQQFGMNMPMGGDEQLLQLAGPYAQNALTNTILSFKNTLDWLSGDTDLLAVSAKILSEPGLVYGDLSKPKFDEESDEALKKRDIEMREAKKTQQHLVELTLVLFLPLLFIAYGVIRWRLRMSARANVSLA